MPCARPVPLPTAPRRLRGVTLIELMIGLAVLALMLMSGAPAFSDWIRNTQIRTASEAILNGVQYARTEAVRRNTTTRFQLTSSLDGQCVVAGSGRNWVVTMGKDSNPKSGCDANPSDTAEPLILQKAAVTSSDMVTIATTRPALAFNGLGQQIAVDGSAPESISVINIASTQGACMKANGSGGTVRCLRIELSRGGQARLCLPGLADTPANRSMACLTP